MNYKILLIALWTLLLVFKLTVSYFDKKSIKNPLKPNVSDIFNADEYKKWSEYESEKIFASIIGNIVSYVFILILVAFDIFALLENVSDNVYVQSIITVSAFCVLEAVVNLPLSYYRSITIESKYGFCEKTLKNFVPDTIKDFILNILLSGGLVCGLIALYEVLNVWLLAALTIAIFAFSLFMAFIYPMFSKVYNKFKSLEEGSLRDKLTALLNKYGYKVSDIKVMDGSRRSTKANAYFAGIGKTKTIVLYDTIVNLLDEDELVAVFAHELAHGKKRHIKKSLVFNLLSIFIMVTAIWCVLELPIYGDFGFQTTNYGFAMIMSMYVLFEFVMSFCGILTNYISRRHEYEADAFAAKEGYGASLVTGLKKLAKNSFSNLSPHPLTVALSYSHPPMSERIQAIEKATANEKSLS